MRDEKGRTRYRRSPREGRAIPKSDISYYASSMEDSDRSHRRIFEAVDSSMTDDDRANHTADDRANNTDDDAESQSDEWDRN